MKKEKKPILVDITRLISAETYSKRYSVSRQTVYNMANDGRLKSVKIDKTMFVVL